MRGSHANGFGRLWRVLRTGLGAALLALGLAAGAASGAVEAGRPACDYCRMIFEDPRFGTEVTLKSGRKKIYDAVECMAAAVLTDSIAVRDIRAVTLVDHARPGVRVPLERTVFLHCPGEGSPMGQSLLAFGSRASADSTCPAPNGTILDWRGVLEQVNSVWYQGKLAVEPHVKIAGAKPAAKTSQPKH
jgi:copper chaperone NosL